MIGQSNQILREVSVGRLFYRLVVHLDRAQADLICPKSVRFALFFWLTLSWSDFKLMLEPFRYLSLAPVSKIGFDSISLRGIYLSGSIKFPLESTCSF